jgi:hypothetical protein
MLMRVCYLECFLVWVVLLPSDIYIYSITSFTADLLPFVTSLLVDSWCLRTGTEEIILSEENLSDGWMEKTAL